MSKTTYLYLQDGTCLPGQSFGYYGESNGEVVFSTGMTGYVESLTDPSFAGQILTFTYPLIGNYGVPSFASRDTRLMETAESERIWAMGVVVSDLCRVGSHATKVTEFSDWLASEKIPGIMGIDTRALTLKLREAGVMAGKISPSKDAALTPFVLRPQVISTPEPIEYVPKAPNGKRIALLDCGVKHGIIRALLDRGYTVQRFPYDVDSVRFETYDAIVCSNGPGNPKDWQATIATLKKTLSTDLPFLGICLGHQLLALSVGADTYKLRYGHRGLNQPCQDVRTKQCFLTSQNHGYAVDVATIPSGYEPWFINLNDQTSEGMKHTTKPIRSVQFHPEGHPGPFDTSWIFQGL